MSNISDLQCNGFFDFWSNHVSPYFPGETSQTVTKSLTLFNFFFFSNGVNLKTISRESASVTSEMTAPWNERALPTLLSDYKVEDIFNADEFGLFYQCLSSKTYHPSGEKCSGGRSSKVRLTGMMAASATGEKLEMFVSGKSKIPRCFKNVKQLPCRYRAHKKSWMTEDLFEKWVRKLDSFFRAQSRKIALLIDNF